MKAHLIPFMVALAASIPIDTHAASCGGNQVIVTILTDFNGAETTWKIYDTNHSVVAIGGPYTGQNFTLISDTACLGTTPVNACYDFILFDGFGDGLHGMGHWSLSNLAGKLLLADQFNTGSTSPPASPASPAYPGHTFCFPEGPAGILDSECNIFNNALLNKVYCNKVTGAANYQFEFSDPDAGFIRRIARDHNYVIFNEMVSNPLTPGVRYFARVRTDKDGPMASAHFGTGCEMGLGVAQVVPCTELINAPAYGHSCNEERTFNSSANNSFIYATPVVGATEYQFHITIPSEGYDETFIRSTYILQLKWNTSVAPPLVNGSTYNVQMNVKVNGLYSGFCPSTCTITINNNAAAPAASITEAAVGNATLWPNPAHDGQVNLNIEGIQDADQQISVDFQDIYGKQVFSKTFGNSGERFTTLLDLPGDIASGVYMVNITVNGKTTVQRLSIMK